MSSIMGNKISGKLMVMLMIAALLATIPVMAGAGLQPSKAQESCPNGAAIESATLYLFVEQSRENRVNVHRITSAWEEDTVTFNSFGGSFDPVVSGSFVAGTVGEWDSVDITSLVQSWAGGTPNYGLLLETEGYHNIFSSSESGTETHRPYLEICYTSGTCTTVQRGLVNGDVADTYIWTGSPDKNYGDELELYSGWLGSNQNRTEKWALLWFELPCPPPPSPGTGTPGYWKNHPEAWPVDEINIGGVIYDMDEAIGIMSSPGKGDMTYNMFNALVSAKLNVLIGNDDSCIADTIDSADEWMEEYGPVGSGVKAGGKNSPWRDGEPLASELDDYNNGLLPCASHRE
ncbi:MAG: DNRLRE domain-containing protein [Dehalococcoidia bacterium]